MKAQAPIRRFGAMKELVGEAHCSAALLLPLLGYNYNLYLSMHAGSADALMEAMKTHSPSLAGVYERSDAMLAVYPGEGARFAKHIDNTTGDRPPAALIFSNILTC